VSVVYVYVDEAGDLGLAGSKHFIVAFLVTRSYDDVTRIQTKSKRLLKRINQKLRPRRKISEFKFSQDSHNTKIRYFSLLQQQTLDIGYMAVNKAGVKSELKEEPVRFYNYVVVGILVRNLLEKYSPTFITVRIDKSMTRTVRNELNIYFGAKVDFLTNQIGRRTIPYDIKHIDSLEDPCIQAVDYLAGAAFHKFEHNDSSYYNMMSPKVKFKEKWGYIEW